MLLFLFPKNSGVNIVSHKRKHISFSYEALGAYFTYAKLFSI